METAYGEGLFLEPADFDFFETNEWPEGLRINIPIALRT